MKNLKVLKIHILYNYQINLRERKFAILIKIVHFVNIFYFLKNFKYFQYAIFAKNW